MSRRHPRARGAGSTSDQLPVVVIGSGPSAAAATAALAAKDVPVVILESGSRQPPGLVIRASGHLLARKMPRGQQTTGDRHRSLRDEAEWWQSLSLGGLSNHWTSAVPRFAPDDFTDGGTMGAEFEWPIRYEELVRHYEVVEQAMDITAGNDEFDQLPLGRARYRRPVPEDWRPIASAAQRHGRGLTSTPMALGPRWSVLARGTEFNSFASLVRPLLGRDDLELRRNCHVTEILPPDDRGRPGVRYRVRPSGAVEELRCRAVVLAAGALASTRILLASRTVDAPDGIGNDRGLVGTHLHDHPRAWWLLRASRSLTLPAHLLYLTRRGYADRPLSGRSWTIGLERSVDRLRTYVSGKGDTFGVQVFGTMVPRVENQVVLLDERDDLGDQRLGISISYSDDEIDLVRGSPGPVAEILTTAGIEMEPPEHVAVGRPGSSVHFGGTIRMHDDPAHGVLDRWNRVHGMPEILVVDKSCFPTGPEKNPTLTMMALAHRAGDRLADVIRGDEGA